MTRSKYYALVIFTFIALVVNVSAQSTTFTYQGRLLDNSLPATASYDFQFELFSVDSGGTAIGTLTRNAIAVDKGIFTVTLDFNDEFPGANRWLQISVKPAGSPSPFVLLVGRQRVTSTPYAIRSANSTLADFATEADTAQTASFATEAGNAQTAQTATDAINAVTAANALELENRPASGFVQNRSTQQPASSFNIDGIGTANTFNATAQYNIGGNRILSVGGTNNLFAGALAGDQNAGTANSFFGSRAGQRNNTAGFNSFFGRDAGRDTETGGSNSFFGANAGVFNISGAENSFFGDSSGLDSTGSFNAFFGRGSGRFNQGGSSNSFFGWQAGNANTTGANNTAIGADADVGSGALTFATAIGAGSIVTTSNTLRLGRNLDTVQIPGNLSLLGSVIGTWSADVLNATQQLNINGLRAFTTSNIGTFAGLNAGAVNTGGANSFFGTRAGQSNLGAISNSFFGFDAGRDNQTGSNNSFYGNNAGLLNVSGAGNSFFGSSAGRDNTANSNSFFGHSSGLLNQSGSANAFFGEDSGRSNVSGGNNSFFGYFSGRGSTGSGNSIFGSTSGGGTMTGGSNSFFGASAGGSTTTGSENVFVGHSAGFFNQGGSNNIFVGRFAGNGNSSGNNNVSVGDSSGFSSNGSDNTFVGRGAGGGNGSGSNNTAIGEGANFGSSTLTYATVVGSDATVSTSNTIALGRSNGSDQVRIPGNATVLGNANVSGTSSFGGNAAFGANAGFGANVSVSGSLGIGTSTPLGPFQLATPNGFVTMGDSTCGTVGPVISFSPVIEGCGTYALSGGLLSTTLTSPTGANSHIFFNAGGLTKGWFNSNEGFRITQFNTDPTLPICVGAGLYLALCSSSARYKTAIESSSLGFGVIDKLRPVTFNWKKTGRRDFGLVAEEVAEVEPMLVGYDENGQVEGVKYDRIGVLLVNVVKEQQVQIDSQKKEISELKAILCEMKPAASVCTKEGGNEK